MRALNNHFLLFLLCAISVFLTSCGTLKVISIDVDNGSQTITALRHPKGVKTAPQTRWSNERLLDVDVKSGEFITITESKDRENCYVNVYSPDGMLRRQFKCPYFSEWMESTTLEIFGDEILTCGELSAGFLDLMLGLLRPQIISHNVKTGRRGTALSNILAALEVVYIMNKFGSEVAIVEICSIKIKDTNNISGKKRIVIYNPASKHCVAVQFPPNINPLFLEGMCPAQKLFWLQAIEEDQDGRFVAEHLFEISLDGSVTDISQILQGENKADKRMVRKIIAKEKSSGEYVYVCSETRKAPENLKRDREYLCSYSPSTGKRERTMLSLGGKDEGIWTSLQYASDERISLVLTTDLFPSRYWEYFWLPPKDRLQIYDRAFNLLKSVPLPRRSTASLFVGNRFYLSYY